MSVRLAAPLVALGLLVSAFAAPATAEEVQEILVDDVEVVAPLDEVVLITSTGSLDPLRATDSPEEGDTTPPSCQIKSNLTGSGSYYQTRNVGAQFAYSFAVSCSGVLRRIAVSSTLTRNGTLVSQGAGSSCSQSNCTRGYSSGSYNCAGPNCYGTYINASFMDLKLYDGYQWAPAQVPGGCSLVETNTRILCNPFKGKPGYVSMYK